LGKKEKEKKLIYIGIVHTKERDRLKI